MEKVRWVRIQVNPEVERGLVFLTTILSGKTSGHHLYEEQYHFQHTVQMHSLHLQSLNINVSSRSCMCREEQKSEVKATGLTERLQALFKLNYFLLELVSKPD